MKYSAFYNVACVSLGLVLGACGSSDQAGDSANDGGTADAAITAVDGALANVDANLPDPWDGHSLDDPYDTSQIVLVHTSHLQGYTLEYFENHAYTCGIRGYQTFLVVYADALPASTIRPLWVRMHGGGVGAFDSNGDYTPIELVFTNNQESEAKLAMGMKERGLVAKVRAHSAGFRFLLPSLCDHDVYSGVGVPDQNNPHSPDENGVVRAADGLLATKAAIAFTRDHYSSSHTFLHGTSAGSIGSFSVALSFEREGLRLSGIVSDSHVLGPGTIDNGNLACMPYPSDPAVLLPKIGPMLTSEWYPQDIVRQEAITVPIYHIWNVNDDNCCGTTTYDYEDEEGNTYQEEGCSHENTPYGDAIQASSNGGAGISVTMKVCVNDPRLPSETCNKHSPTKIDFSAPGTPGDQLHGNRDYNQHILDWVDQRLQESAP